jgi:ASCH domain
VRALSLWQPWASLVASGRKRIENRPWPTKVRGRVLIHAGKKVDDPMGCAAMCARLGVPLPDERSLERGGIVGAVTIVDCVERSDDPFFFGPFGFVLEDARPIALVPCRGMLGFFSVPPDVEARVRELGERGST